MGTLTRDQIFNKDDLKRETIEVPEWGGSVTIRELTGREHQELAREAVSSKDEDDEARGAKFITSLLQKVIVDEEGQPLFGPDDIDELTSKSSRVLQRLFTEAQRISKIRASDIEEIEKNSGATPTSGSSSS
jgi:hypothetical protein